MDLPVIETPVFPRWIWIEEITYSHIPIATMVTAFMLLAPVLQYVSLRRKDPRYDRLAKGFIWFAMILFSPGAALGTGIPIFIIGAYPEFWSRWSNLFFWPLIVQFLFFLCEVAFLFFGYYLTWDRWANRKRLHIFMGVMAAFFGLLVQIVWDALGSYMLTPGSVPLPGVTEAVGWSAKAFFNPSFPYLLSHRIFGNFSYVMLMVGGVYALKQLFHKDPEAKAYWRWASGFCFTMGYLFFFAMPVIGWFYAMLVQREAPAAFWAIMGGHVSVVFTLKMCLIGVFVTLGGAYLFILHRGKKLLWAITAGLVGLMLVLHAHPPLRWLGDSKVAWRVLITVMPLGLIAALWRLGGRGDPEKTRWRWMMMVAGIAAFFAFAIGGFVRERSKAPDTVYEQIAKPERDYTTLHQIEERLLYDKILNRNFTPVDLRNHPRNDWEGFVRQARQNGKAQAMSDDEARRIVAFLQEQYR